MTITAGAPELAQGYEALRAEALGLAPPTRPRGRAVLIGSGLPAWMTALAPIAPIPVLSGRPLPAGTAAAMAGTANWSSCCRRWWGRGAGHEQRSSSEGDGQPPRPSGLFVRAPEHFAPGVQNTESTKRQYALRDRAMALGWPAERVVVIDSDLGLSELDNDREGFQRLVAAVGLGEVGVVLGLEVSRLARSSSDWHRLLGICALTDTLILDEDGIYNPAQFNDRLLLA